MSAGAGAGSPGARSAGAQPGIDPRGPRFGAAITAVLLLVVVGLALSGQSVAATATLAVLVAIFAWGAFAGIRRHPWGRLYARLVAPRLAPPTHREDPAALVLHLLGVPGALVVAASMAFVAAFLNAVFDYCLGCQLYVLLVRAGVIRPRRAQSPA